MLNEPNRSQLVYNYRSYLLRFWRDKPPGGWRASAQCVQTGNTVLFGDVESLLTFLQREVGAESDANTTDIPPLATPAG
jgi:hypothetical protein